MNVQKRYIEQLRHGGVEGLGVHVAPLPGLQAHAHVDVQQVVAFIQRAGASVACGGLQLIVTHATDLQRLRQGHSLRFNAPKARSDTLSNRGGSTL